MDPDIINCMLLRIHVEKKNSQPRHLAARYGSKKNSGNCATVQPRNHATAQLCNRATMQLYELKATKKATALPCKVDGHDDVMGQVAEQADVGPVVDDGRGHEDDEGQRDADDVDEKRR